MAEAAHTPRADTSAPPVCFRTDADVYAFNDSAGSEVGSIVDDRDGRWIAILLDVDCMAGRLSTPIPLSGTTPMGQRPV